MLEELIKIAFAARKYAYVPYSRFKVGAALLTKSNRVYTGCNIENHGIQGICGERTAFAKALSEGEREFESIIVCGAPNGEEPTNECMPCGYCRQFMSEFVDDNFTFIDLENDGVPIDLFNIEDYNTLPKRKNTLLGIMAASTEKLHVQQIATLKKIVSGLLKKDDIYSISLDDIMLELEILIEAKDKCAPAVMNRFESIYEDINEIGMSKLS